MDILLKIDMEDDFVNYSIEDGDGFVTCEDIYKSTKDKAKYRVLAAKVNNELKPLTSKVKAGDKVELLDMRTQAANLIYQNSLVLVYIKAVLDVVGDARVNIENSLNKGLYTFVSLKNRVITEDDVKKIEDRMVEIIEADEPIMGKDISKEEALSFLEAQGFDEKVKLCKDGVNTDSFKFYELLGYSNFFYSYMVPSTGYVDKFDLRKYKRGVLLRFPHPSNPNEMPVYVDENKIYDAFAEATRWQELLGIDYVTDLNEHVRKGDIKEIIQLSEALHEKKIVEIAEEITTKQKRIILIAGPSSSGKTTFARRLCVQLMVNGLKPIYLGTDDYFINREDMPVDEKGERDFESLEAVDLKLFEKDMNDLLAGKVVDIPTFDFIEGKKLFGKRLTSLGANQPIVIEGIHALNKKMTSNIEEDTKYKIYISPFTQINIDRHNRIPTTDARKLRRMVRDYKYRGRGADSTIRDWSKVRAGEDKNIFPFSGEADVVFNSVHIYELAVLKKYAKPLLQSVTPDMDEYSEANRMLEFLKYVREIDDDQVIANNSILREFIGGSIFV